MSKFFFFTLILFCTIKGMCSKCDSLHVLLNKNNLEDTTNVNLLLNLSEFFEEKASDSCVFYAKKALSISLKKNYYKFSGRAYNAIGAFYNSKGEYEKALFNFIEGYKIYEKINAVRAMSNLQNSMGNTYLGILDTGKAVIAYTKSYALASSDSLKYMMGISSIGLGNIYLIRKQYLQALNFFTRAKDIFKNTPKALYPLSISYTCIGSALFELNKFDEAFENFNIAVEQLKNLNNSYGVAGTYELMGKAYGKKNDLDNSLKYFLKSMEIFSERKAYDDLKNVCFNISNTYKQKGDFEKALNYFEKFSAFHDSVFNSTNNEQLLDVETKYQTEKKVQEIEVQKLKMKEQDFQRNVLIISVIVIVLILVLVYNRYSVKRKANNDLSLANSNLEIKNTIIEQKNNEITDSIKYAQRIQNAILPSLKRFSKALPQSFIVYKPKDIVSGDFYWMETIQLENSEKLILFAAADCTGHGVPGALVSVICRDALNITVKELGITDPGKILDKVRELVLETFGQNEIQNSTGEVQDGMDISLCSLNTQTKQLLWAGANNPIWILKKEASEMLHIKGNKQPVGLHLNSTPFTTHTINILKDDLIYIFTDGFADQFGGPKGKKFKYKQLNNFLIENRDISIPNLSEKLDQKFEEWRGSLEQVDDVLLIGIKIE